MPVRIPGPRAGKVALVALALLLIGAVVIRSWVVPAVLVGRIEAVTGGQVTIGGWWVSPSSAGVTGLTVRGKAATGAPVWARAGRVKTDLTLGSLLRGRFAPSRLTVENPDVTIRLDRQGQWLDTFGAGKRSGSADRPAPIPVVVLQGATLTFRQEGRPEMVVRQVTGRLGPDGDSLSVALRSSDPGWGPLEATGLFANDFSTGKLDLRTVSPVRVTPAQAREIPWVTPLVWDNADPDGPIRIRLTLERGDFAGRPLRVETVIDLLGTALQSHTLGLTATRTSGRVTVRDTLVRVEKVAGQAAGGTVAADGTLDFGASPARFDVGLDLQGVDVASAPPRWQLAEAGVTGKLRGKVHLLARLDPGGVDLSGTSGDGTVENGTIEGIPFKSLKLNVKANGDDLQYDSPKSQSSRPALKTLGALALLAFQAPAVPKAEAPKADAPPAAPAPRGLRSITTQLELEDVDVALLVAKAQGLLGVPVPIPVTGRLALKAEATIPLGQLHEIKRYAFHGDLTLTKASLFRVDLGRLSARVDLAEGKLDLKDVRGLLVNKPDGGPDNPPAATPPVVPAEGPLPPGGFRGTLSAQLDPPGRLTAHFEGGELPLGELAAPALPRPTPLSGLLTVNLDAQADLKAASDPAAWSIRGTAQSQQIRYQHATLDAFATRFGLETGTLEVAELSARLVGKPLQAHAKVGLKAPFAIDGAIDVSGWDLAAVLAWVPGVPPTLPISGTVTGRASARGTLSPVQLTTEGGGKFDSLVAGPVALGVVPFSWTTRAGEVVLTVSDARPFGGKLAGEAVVPLGGKGPTHGSVTLDGIDAARLSDAMPGQSLKLTGKVSGRAEFTVPGGGTAALDADAKISSADLTINGLPAENVRVGLNAARGALHYELTADSLGGKVKLKGDIPLAANAPPPARRDEWNGELQAVNFRLGPAWQAFGMKGAWLGLAGRGAVDANLRLIRGGDRAGFYSHGVAEFRDLEWDTPHHRAPLGRVKAIVTSGPGTWRLDPVSGDLLGGQLSGVAWGTPPPTPGQPPQRGFEFRLDRAPLSHALALGGLDLPAVEGFLTVRAAGTLGDSLRATADVTVPHAQVAGFPVTEVRLPAAYSASATGEAGVLQLRHWTARIAGGHVRGDASFRVGAHQAFRADVRLDGVEIESLARALSEARRPATGKLSGKVQLAGAQPSETRTYRGKFDLALTDASVVSLPVFKEIDRFLGASSGGLFEQGELTGSVARNEFVLETLGLEGRLVQLHGTGTVGFDGQLNLDMLVNTSQIIPQTGQALVSNIPGLSAVLGRDREAMLRVANFLSNKLLKFRVTGTVKNPSVALDPGVIVTDAAVGFFSGVLKLPLGFVK